MDLKENLVSRHLVFKGKNPNTEWMEGLRLEAIDVFDKQGFPKRKDEEWRFTNLTPLLKKDYKLFPETEDISIGYKDFKQYLLHDMDTYDIVFVNGVYSSYLSSTTHEEADICVLSCAMEKMVYRPVIENYYGKIAPKEESLVSLNTAFCKDGAYIYVPDKVILSKPIQVIFLSTAKEEEIMYHPRNLIVIGNNSQAQIIERHQTLNGKPNLTNSVSEIHVGRNSELDYYKIQNDTVEASLIDHTYIEQERDSVASVHTFSFGGNLTRNDLNFTQKGENCNSILNGITVIGGKQHVDHHTKVDHRFPNCDSHELYKGIFDENSHGVFNGKIYVHPEAQKLNSFQQNNNVLLTDKASIDTKPQLEIFADDVKCSHGCTVGQLDNMALFYMQQRGIPKKEAQALLLYAFAAEVLEHVKIPQIKTRITTIIAKKLNIDIDFDL
ncbi:MAG: Fe-S cluster assembly protein SufD [Weeksellaceae bacterium]|jgi:Fe-S cluster assembly protein SufD|nr:Fe-S cluster assembly protein SufD [Weeksellaceae bacterium]MDX9705675.1 Fe-S cluster assembly protein SufD [Weeksellaceae bacterium]